jgi:hypothetical protein
VASRNALPALTVAGVVGKKHCSRGRAVGEAYMTHESGVGVGRVEGASCRDVDVAPQDSLGAVHLLPATLAPVGEPAAEVEPRPGAAPRPVPPQSRPLGMGAIARAPRLTRRSPHRPPGGQRGQPAPPTAAAARPAALMRACSTRVGGAVWGPHVLDPGTASSPAVQCSRSGSSACRVPLQLADASRVVDDPVDLDGRRG